MWETSENDFSDSECPNLGIFQDTGSLQACKDLCLEDAEDADGSGSGCTAFNYNSNTKTCIMRGCSLPVVPPANDNNNHFDGYWPSSTSRGSCKQEQDMLHSN